MSASKPLYWFVTLKHGQTHLHCWVDKHVKLGNIITLKSDEADDRQWRVLYVSSQARPKDELNSLQTWHVGGL